MNHVVVDPVKMDLYAFVLKDACDEFFEVDVAERILRPIFLTPGKGAAACATGGMDVRAAAELFVCEEDRAGFLALFSRQSLDEVCAHKIGKQGEFRRMQPGGRERWVRGTLFSCDACGRDKALFYTVDIESRNAARLMQMNRDLFGVFLDAYIGIAELDLDLGIGTIIQCIPMPDMALRSFKWGRMVGYLCSNVIYHGDRDIFAGTFSLKHMREVWGNGQKNMSLEVRYSADGETFRWAEVNAMLFRREDMPDKVYLAMRDTSEQHLLKGIVERYVYSHCDYFIYLNARNNSYVMFSSKGDGTLLPPDHCDDYERAIETYVRKYIAPEDQELAIHEMRISRVLEELDRTGEHCFYCGVMDSRRGYTRKRLQYLYYDKENQMVLMTRTDVTDIYLEQKRQNKLLQRALMQAQTDPLTGLYNQAVKEMIAERLEGEDGIAAVLFMDLDNFKVINDTLGHIKGDLLLQEVAGVLKKTLRASDLSGRVGGDEFIALLHPVSSPAGVRQCVQRICSSVHSVMDRDFNDFSVTCSIGISMYPADGNDIAALVEKADKAAYAVKRKGKNGFAFYSDLL